MATLGHGGTLVKNVPEIGPHHLLVVVEKNVNPHNKMVIYTKLNAKGGFMADPSNNNRPLLDYYWLMDGKRYKPVNQKIKNEIQKRFVSQWGSDGRVDSFTVSVGRLKELDCDIKNPRMEVYAKQAAGGVSVEVQMDLGPSDGNKRIRLSGIYAEGRAFPTAVYSAMLKGEEIVHGKVTRRKIARTYHAPGRS